MENVYIVHEIEEEVYPVLYDEEGEVVPLSHVLHLLKEASAKTILDARGGLIQEYKPRITKDAFAGLHGSDG